MKITDMKVFIVDPHGPGGSHWMFIKLTTDNGISGIGKMYAVPL